MQKIKFRPPRLIRVPTDQLSDFAVTMATNKGGCIMGSEDGLNIPQNELPNSATEATPPSPGAIENAVSAEIPHGESEARRLLQRTPGNYLLNQVYGFWFLISLFLLAFIITRKV